MNAPQIKDYYRLIPAPVMATYGVPEDHIDLLIDTFGPVLPLDSPALPDVLRWSMALSPWEDVASLLTTWVCDAFKSVELTKEDYRVQTVLATLVPNVNRDEAMYTLHSTYSLIDHEVRRRGLQEVGVSDAILDDDYPRDLKAWSAAGAAVRTALVAAERPENGDLLIGAIGRYVALWSLSLLPMNKRSLCADRYCQASVARLVGFIKSWSTPAPGEN